MSTIIIIGGTGELGYQTVLAAEATDGTGWSGNIIATYHNSAPKKGTTRTHWQPLDCSDHKAVRSMLASQTSLAAVLYCAVPKGANANAKTSDVLRSGIVDDVLNCAEAVCMIGARFVAVSTDLVFNGNIPTQERYTVDSQVSPMNAYGKYKAEMEKRLFGLNGKIIIARTSLILTVGDDVPYGKGAQFVVDCINGKHGQIELFTDETRSMSFADDLGRVMVELGKKDCPHSGVVHMVSEEATNRWELAKLLAKRMSCENLLGKDVSSGLSSQSSMKRPLNCALVPSTFNTRIQGISERLA